MHVIHMYVHTCNAHCAAKCTCLLASASQARLDRASAQAQRRSLSLQRGREGKGEKSQETNAGDMAEQDGVVLCAYSQVCEVVHKFGDYFCLKALRPKRS